MIRRVKITDPERCLLSWWKDIPWLQAQKKEILFKPGLNVLYGPNGSGKSTVLTLIAKMLCCYDGTRQLVGDYTTQDYFDGPYGERKLKTGVVPVHDGSPILHFDPSQTVGLIGGSFDYDFIHEGAANSMLHESAGNTSAHRMGTTLAAVFGNEWPEPQIKWKVREERFPDLAKMLKGTLKKSKPTVLLDEPGRSLDLGRLTTFFHKLAKVKDVQVILATHSPFALRLEGAHYIETEKDYLKLARVHTDIHFIKEFAKNPGRYEKLKRFLAKTEAEDG